LVVPEDERFSGPWWVTVIIGTVFWCVVGFVIGAFGPKARPSTPSPESRQKPAVFALRSLFAFLGQLLYRGLVGYLVATITMGAYWGLVFGLGYVFRKYLDSLRGESFAIVLMSAFGASGMGGLSGAVFGGLFAPTESQGKKERWTIVKAAAIGNLLGLVLAAHVGAICGTVVDFLYGQEALKKTGEDFLFVLMAIGGGAGIVGGVLSGFWFRFRRKHQQHLDAHPAAS